jgi:hypothetical protein
MSSSGSGKSGDVLDRSFLNCTRSSLALLAALARRFGIVEWIVFAVTGDDREAEESDVDGGQD